MAARRLLKNPLVDHGEILAPFAQVALAQASEGGQTLQLLMDQSDLGFVSGVMRQS